MTLLLSVFAAVTVTFLWYRQASSNPYKLSVLCWLFWGASLMWLVDAVFEYAELGAEYFQPAAGDMLNDSYLGLSVIALGLVVWLLVLLVTDPKGEIRRLLLARRQK